MSAFRSSGLSHLDKVLDSHLGTEQTPGLAALVARGGETHVHVAGVKEWDGAAVERDSIFRIASMSKPITAVATLILAEEGSIELDAPIERWLPELADRQVLSRIDSAVNDTVPAQRSITPRDCLTFTLGHGMLMTPHALPFQENEAEAGYAPGPPQPQVSAGADDWLRGFSALPLIHQPGERWLYNTGSLILSVLVARASGMPLDEYLHERIFAPLGMWDTSFWVPEEKLDRFTAVYMKNFESPAGEAFLFDDARTGQWTSRPAFPQGDGGLVSTVDDFARFAAMLAGAGAFEGSRIVSEASVREMTTNHLSDEVRARSGMGDGDFEHAGFGFGVTVLLDSQTVEGNTGAYGWDGGLGSGWRNDPSTGTTTILLTNRAWDGPFLPQIFKDFWAAAYAAVDA